MKKYTIISTFPENGTQNIGDQLITSSTMEAIRAVKGGEVNFNIVWREAEWDKVKDSILDSDAVIFACLALREDMANKEYPYLQNLLESGIPLGVIAAGTSLNVATSSDNLYNGFTESAVESLHDLNKKAIFFTTRGYISQAFCVENKLDKVTHSGDIAFFDPRFFDRKFQLKENIKSIAISDPHYGGVFLNSLKTLLLGLKKVFPSAELVVLRHGINQAVENFCKENGFAFRDIYLDKNLGLDIYDQFDLHVGYRVHAHVSALKRRKPSYLLEQDGRGCDYGLTLNRRTTVSSFITQKSEVKTYKRYRLISTQKVNKVNLVSLFPVYQILAMVEQDAQTGFQKFLGLEDQIKLFNNLCLDALKKLP
jgi:hypothetical protein